MSKYVYNLFVNKCNYLLISELTFKYSKESKDKSISNKNNSLS